MLDSVYGDSWIPTESLKFDCDETDERTRKKRTKEKEVLLFTTGDGGTGESLKPDVAWGFLARDSTRNGLRARSNADMIHLTLVDGIGVLLAVFWTL